VNETRVTQENRCCNLGLCGGGYGDRSTGETFIRITPSTVSVIEYLTTLRVTNQYKDGVRALRVERVHLRCDGSDTFDD
jgi:hypothetical protein